MHPFLTFLAVFIGLVVFVATFEATRVRTPTPTYKRHNGH